MTEPPNSEERVLRADYRARRRVHPARVRFTVGLVALFRPGRFLYPRRWQWWADLALHACAAAGSEPGVRALLRMGADLDSRESYCGLTPLLTAARACCPTTARLLIDVGADVNARGKIGDTALGLAAEEGAAAIVDLLLRNGAVVNAQGHLGFTPLIQAAGSGRLDVVRLLVEHSADPNIAAIRGLDAVRWAALHGHDRCAEWLRRHGASPEDPTG